MIAWQAVRSSGSGCMSCMPSMITSCADGAIAVESILWNSLQAPRNDAGPLAMPMLREKPRRGRRATLARRPSSAGPRITLATLHRIERDAAEEHRQFGRVEFHGRRVSLRGLQGFERARFHTRI